MERFQGTDYPQPPVVARRPLVTTGVASGTTGKALAHPGGRSQSNKTDRRRAGSPDGELFAARMFILIIPLLNRARWKHRALIPDGRRWWSGSERSIILQHTLQRVRGCLDDVTLVELVVPGVYRVCLLN